MKTRWMITNGLAGLKERLDQKLPSVTAGIGGAFTPALLFVIILVIGIFARVWQFGEVPPGLNQDEASIGVEAYDLYHFGVDRNGFSYPVEFLSWGNGMDALEGYVLIPFMTLGLNPVTVRLPILISGILTLLLVFFVAKRSFGLTVGLLSMFLLAISPWHILMSRWGINENILPFVFMLGFACLILTTPKNQWFIGAMIFFGLTLYAYGAMYVAMPVFLILAIPLMVYAKRVSTKTLISGLLLFAIVITPILICIVINIFGWNTIEIGKITIPHLLGTARFLSVSATSSSNPIKSMIYNASIMFKLLLINQSDGLIFNSVGQFGYLYPFSFPLAVLGVGLLFPYRKTKLIPEKMLVLAWLLAALCIGLFLNAQFNRIQLVFIPIILCTAAFLDWLGRQHRVLLALMVCIYLVSFFSFNKNYHGIEYYKDATHNFYPGLIPALQYASQQGEHPICVTNLVTDPYIYVLLAEPENPSSYLNTIEYTNPNEGFREVRTLSRYIFGLDSCREDPKMIYVLYYEKIPDTLKNYLKKDFTDFHVYIPPSDQISTKP